MKILIISLAGIGDTLIATPLIHELRASFPDARIDALVLWAGSRDLLQGNPHLNTIHQRNLIKTGKAGSLRFLFQLRKEKYDVAINTHPQGRIHYRIVSRIVGARRRLSHRYECAGALDRLLVTDWVDQDYSVHSVENNLRLLPLLGVQPALASHRYEVFLRPEETAWAEAFSAGTGRKAGPCIGFHVGSGGTKNLTLKRWPLENYVALIRRITAQHPEALVWLFGGPEEGAAHARILAECGSTRVLEAKTQSLMQAAALMQHCDAFVSVDTALMHLAAAMQVKNQIVIEAPTFNKTNEPFGNAFTLVPNPAVAGRNLEYYRYDGRAIQGTDEELIRLMNSVPVDAVYQALAQRLQWKV